MPGTLTDMIIVATEAHRGQFDKMGQPYILHPLRVMGKMDEEMDRQIAMGHDIIEDTEMTAKELLRLGFCEYVVTGIVAMTKIKGEDPMFRLGEIMKHPGARKVKIADIEDNLDVWRDPKRGKFDPKDKDRLEKYYTYHAILTGR